MAKQIRICMHRVATNPANIDTFNIYHGFCDISAKMFASDVRDMFGVVPIVSLEVRYVGVTLWYIDVEIAGTPNDILERLIKGEKIIYDRTSSETWEYTLVRDLTQNLLLNSTMSVTTYFNSGEERSTLPFTGTDKMVRMYRNEYVRIEGLHADVPELEEKPIEDPVPKQTALSLLPPEEQPEEDL